jgi:hypothetical protein
MANLDSAIQELREQRRTTELQMEKLDSAISVLESLSGERLSMAPNNGAHPKRIISAAARRRMARAQRARRSKEREGSGAMAAMKEGNKKTRRVLSAQARRKIAAAQRARWARVRGQKAA